jgi:hypothetical protein
MQHENEIQPFTRVDVTATTDEGGGTGVTDTPGGSEVLTDQFRRIQRHLRAPDNEKPFACAECGKHFFTKHQLDSHRAGIGQCRGSTWGV